MATIKSYTDIEQSQVLSKILPLESADMFYADLLVDSKHKYISHYLETYGFKKFEDTKTRESEHLGFIPCWSLAALLKYLNGISPQVYTPILFPSEGKWILQFTEYGHGNMCEVACDNPVDACVAMIIKLSEVKIL